MLGECIASQSEVTRANRVTWAEFELCSDVQPLLSVPNVGQINIIHHHQPLLPAGQEVNRLRRRLSRRRDEQDGKAPFVGRG